MFCVCLCARFQSCPKESHLVAVKRIIRYLKGTIEMGLWYRKTRQFSMTSFSDADYAGCRVDRKSTSETCQFLGNCLFSWSSKKQNSVSQLASSPSERPKGTLPSQPLVKPKNSNQAYEIQDPSINQCNAITYCDLENNQVYQQKNSVHIDPTATSTSASSSNLLHKHLTRTKLLNKS